MANKMRLGGLISGMDTDTIITQLVAGRRKKVETKKGDQTKISWKQDIWKDLNKQLKSLQSEANNIRFSSAFSKKTTSVSNSSKASVITSDRAVDSVQSLKIDKLAKTAYLTGGTVDGDGKATALSTLGELGFSGEGSFKVDGTDKTINVSASTTISDVLSQLQDAGLNASFDANNQRLFVSAKKSGEDSNFSFTALNSDGSDALAKLGLQTKEYYTAAQTYTDGDVNATISSRLDAIKNRYEANVSKQSALRTEIDDIKAKYSLDELSDTSELIKTAETNIDDLKKQLEELKEEDYATPEEYKTAKENLEKDIESAKTKLDDMNTLSTKEKDAKNLSDAIMADASNFNIDVDGNYTASDKLIQAVKDDYATRATAAADKLADNKAQYATKIDGTNAEITLNGAKFTSNTNVFEVNGLTITAQATTDPGEEITLTTQNDTSGIYDMVKNFLKSYNNIINQLDKLYNAESASKYSMLSDEEKESLSEKEVEKYETKIKDSLLRRDESVGSLVNSLTEAMAGGFKVGDKTLYLSNFGINTLSYFTAADNEKHALHIDGDKDDDSTSGNEDVLKSMITSDPDTVVSFFTQLSNELYTKMSDLSKSVNGVRSFGSFYDDKKMKTEYTDYTSKIAEMEEKVNAYEDKLYKQYAAMETALAKLQSNSSAVAGLIGS